INMDDGLKLRCDIYRPVAGGKYPVIMTLGPYGKWLHFDDLYSSQWRRMCADQPDVPTDSTNKYQCWEVVDPEKWVPDGYVCIRGVRQDWSKAQVYSVQNGRGTRGFKSRMNGDWVSGPETLSEEQLGQNRRDFYQDCISRKLDTDPYWRSRMPDWSKVKTPLF